MHRGTTHRPEGLSVAVEKRGTALSLRSRSWTLRGSYTRTRPPPLMVQSLADNPVSPREVVRTDSRWVSPRPRRNRNALCVHKHLAAYCSATDQPQSSQGAGQGLWRTARAGATVSATATCDSQKIKNCCRPKQGVNGCSEARAQAAGLRTRRRSGTPTDTARRGIGALGAVRHSQGVAACWRSRQHGDSHQPPVVRTRAPLRARQHADTVEHAAPPPLRDPFPTIVRACSWHVAVAFASDRAPKGIKYTCELTGEPATVQTEINGVTYCYACVRSPHAGVHLQDSDGRRATPRALP